MFVDYLFYLKALTEEERNKQILTIILIWAIMVSIAVIFEFVKRKSKEKKV